MESEANNFIIIIIADDQKRGRGLKANVQFIANKDQTHKKMPKIAHVKKSKLKNKGSLFDMLDTLSF